MAARIDHKKEINGVFYLAVSVILAITYYWPGIRTGWLGNSLFTGGRGLIGTAALALPVVFFYMALDYLLEKRLKVTRLRFTYVLILLVAVAALLQTITISQSLIRELSQNQDQDILAFEALKTLWQLGVNPNLISSDTLLMPGGLLGGLLALAVETIAGSVGALVLLGALILSMLVLLFNVSVSKAVDNTARAIKTTHRKVDEALRQGVSQARQRQEANAQSGNYDLKLDDAADSKTDTQPGDRVDDDNGAAFDVDSKQGVTFDPPSDPQGKKASWREQLKRLWSPETADDQDLDKSSVPGFLKTGDLDESDTVDSDKNQDKRQAAAETGDNEADNPSDSRQDAGLKQQSAYDLKLNDPDWVMSPAENLDKPEIPTLDQHQIQGRQDNEADDEEVVLPAGVHRVGQTDRKPETSHGSSFQEVGDQEGSDQQSGTAGYASSEKAYGYSDRDDADHHEPDRSQWIDRSEDPGIDADLTEAQKKARRHSGQQMNIPWQPPSLELLKRDTGPKSLSSNLEINRLGRKLEKTLESFGINASVVRHSTGPTITRFELAPGPGVKVSRIVSLADDIALNLAAIGVRIEAPIPGKAAIGIEIPNKETTPVLLRGLLESSDYRRNKHPLTVAIGRDIQGRPILCDLTKMPHLLIAGATGSGKSVCINAVLMSILFKSSPDEVKMIMIDPKVVELNVYNGIPHLISPVVTDPKKAANALIWAVNEMTRRYGLFAEKSVRDINAYQEAASRLGDESYEDLALILIVIDELSDLMATSPTEVEDAIARLTAMARAAGIHLIIATQRPSVDVITGVIKANIPSRIAFAVASQVDSRTILDTGGAEKLLGKGDMLFYPQSASKPLRGQGAFISDPEVERVLTYIKGQHQAEYDDQVTEAIMTSPSGNSKKDIKNQEKDELLPQALELCVEAGYASVSLLQRRMNVGYPRAARLIDALHDRGYVGPFEGSKPRKILISPTQYQELMAKGDL